PNPQAARREAASFRTAQFRRKMEQGFVRMTRIGFATGYDHRVNVADFARAVKDAEDRNFEIGFFSETWALMRDSVTALSAFALATRRMTLGCTQIVRLRSPVLMAQ